MIPALMTLYHHWWSWLDRHDKPERGSGSPWTREAVDGVSLFHDTLSSLILSLLFFLYFILSCVVCVTQLDLLGISLVFGNEVLYAAHLLQCPQDLLNVCHESWRFFFSYRYDMRFHHFWCEDLSFSLRNQRLVSMIYLFNCDIVWHWDDLLYGLAGKCRRSRVLLIHSEGRVMNCIRSTVRETARDDWQERRRRKKQANFVHTKWGLSVKKQQNRVSLHFDLFCGIWESACYDHPPDSFSYSLYFGCLIWNPMWDDEVGLLHSFSSRLHNTRLQF